MSTYSTETQPRDRFELVGTYADGCGIWHAKIRDREPDAHLRSTDFATLHRTARNAIADELFERAPRGQTREEIFANLRTERSLTFGEDGTYILFEM